jgi:hypothetical protein
MANKDSLESAVDDMSELLIELETLNTGSPFSIPVNITVPEINIDFHKELDYFWRSFFHPAPAPSVEVVAAPPSDEPLEDDPDYVQPLTALGSEVESDDGDSSSDIVEVASTSRALPSCRCKCAFQVPKARAERLMKEVAPLDRESRRKFVHAIMLASYEQPSEATTRTASGVTKKKQTPHDRFYLFGTSVCYKFFRCLVGEANSGKSLVASILKRLETGEVMPGNSRYVGSTTEQHAATRTLREWLTFLANHHGLPIPHARWSTKLHTAVQLPATYSKSAVYKVYASEISHHVSSSFFFRIWRTEFSWLRVADQYTDYCNTCYTAKAQSNRLALIEHMSFVRLQQHFIKTFFAQVMMSLHNVDASNRARWLSLDFAQSIRLPMHASYQPGQSFFQTGLCIDIFGLCDDVNLQNQIYLLPEGHCAAAKDANTILSILYHYLQQPHRDSAASTLILHGDNCAGQLKNRFLVWFCVWLLSQPQFAHIHDIHVLYNLPGHTKFSPDRAFAAVKRQLRGCSVFSPSAVQARVSSLPSFSSICMSTVTTYDWRRFLGLQYRDTMPGIASSCHWHFRSSAPHQVVSQAFATSEKVTTNFRFERLAEDVTLAQHRLPSVPLTRERREEIRNNLSSLGNLVDLDLFFGCACIEQ